jgi:hypothetical protein
MYDPGQSANADSVSTVIEHFVEIKIIDNLSSDLKSLMN